MCFRGYIISNWQPDLYLANQEAASGINFCVEYADRTDARDEYMEAKKRVERGEEAKSWQWWQTGALLWGNAFIQLQLDGYPGEQVFMLHGPRVP